MLILYFESVAVVPKLQAKFLCIERQPGFKIARAGIFESVRQRLLSDMQQIFLPGQGQVAHFATNIESCVKRSPCSCVLNESFQGFPEVSSLQSLRPQRVNGPACLVQAPSR